MPARPAPAPVSLPLSFRTADLEEARTVISETYYANSLDQLDPGDALDARFDIVRLGPLTLGECSFGTELRARFGELGSYHVDVLLTGHMSWRQGRHVPGPATATSSRAAVFQPDGDTTIDRWSRDCRLLAVKIDAAALEQHLEQLLGRPIRRPVRFSPEFDVSQGPGRSWTRLVKLAVHDMRDHPGLLGQPLVVKPLQETLLNGLLLAAGHRHRDELMAPTPSLRPVAVKRVVDAIQAHPEHAFNTAELAAIGQVSVRWLQEGFRRHVGMSPMAYLRDVRLCRVRDDLRHSGPGELSVGEAAYRWGFVHLGRFASSYRARFGETPSQTLHTP
ncbi:AraC family transcriptional regulator [Streptomyces sp. MST-110588]|uniref:AraC family transcriptional regulator n=1 Tax=Streptomyces sp. MST-110588 TaxID=2833628 RepID=UPI001F5D591D|nr:AraC family transcriptional regulator [Streptomyces sp. MST-110588]UNO41120.1 AraC family transcriptional regulator [Streptomyces sp. MST-110588]